MRTRSPGLGGAGARRRRRVHCVGAWVRKSSGSVGVLVDGGHMKNIAAAVAVADIASVEAESSADAARERAG
eukprot:250223-Pleurochrysis_carterae.AAC.1